MDLSFTAEQEALREAVRRFCAERVTVASLRDWEGEPRGIDESTWRASAALGWYGVGVPAEAGGSGLELPDVACLLQECARRLVPRAVLDAIRGGWALARLDPAAPELSAVARGACTVTLAIDGPGVGEPGGSPVRVEAGTVSGTAWYVPAAAWADYQIVAASEGDRTTLVLVGRDQVRQEPLRTFDGQRQAIVCYDRSPIVRRLERADVGPSAVAGVRREQVALALAEMVGGMEATLDLTVAYVKEREQFGQKIAVFQAVQHQVADMATALTASRHLAWQAVTRVAGATEEGHELDAAAAYVGEAFKRLTLTAHHLHGGAGYILEHPLHYHSERAQALCIRYAPEAPALSRIARRLLD